MIYISGRKALKEAFKLQFLKLYLCIRFTYNEKSLYVALMMRDDSTEMKLS